MRIYVAASQHDWQRARDAMASLRTFGHTITHDWTGEVEHHAAIAPREDELRLYAEQDFEGVRSCDAILALTPPWKSWGCGLWTELGIALAMGKLCIVTGPRCDANIFARLCTRVGTDLEGLAILEGMT